MANFRGKGKQTLLLTKDLVDPFIPLANPKPFDEHQVIQAFHSLPNKKAPGLDGITPEQLKGSLLFLSHGLDMAVQCMP